MPTGTIAGDTAELAALLQLEMPKAGLTAVVRARSARDMHAAHVRPEQVREFLCGTHRLTEVLPAALDELCAALAAGRLPEEGIVVASHGRPAKHGEDGRLHWLIGSDQPGPPPETESGHVDFFAMADFRAVQKGQEFAELLEPTRGEDGADVCGVRLPARAGKPIKLEPGTNVTLDAATRRFRAETDGRVELRGHLVCVSNVLDIKGDVDFHTGNIQFPGMVNVSGCIHDNFQVDAREGVCVRGVVEAARIKAGGSVTLMGGLNGRDHGRVEAGAEVVAKFITNGDIVATGDLKVTKEIVSSRAHGHNVVVSGGAIVGSDVSAEETIHCQEAGNADGPRTLLAVNYNVFHQREAADLQQRIGAMEKALGIIRDNLAKVAEAGEKLSPDSAFRLGKLREHVQRLESELGLMRARHAELSKPPKKRDGTIEVRNGIHPGVILRIGKYERQVKQHFPGRRKVYFDAEKYEIAISGG